MDTQAGLDHVVSGLRESAALKIQLAEEAAPTIVRAAAVIAESLKSGGKVLLFGNGGSAADAQHLAAEFVGRFAMERKALPAIALTTDTSILTAVGNDYGYEHVFVRQVQALGRAIPGTSIPSYPVASTATMSPVPPASDPSAIAGPTPISGSRRIPLSRRARAPGPPPA